MSKFKQFQEDHFELIILGGMTIGSILIACVATLVIMTPVYLFELVTK